jgi:hypothetical protein
MMKERTLPMRSSTQQSTHPRFSFCVIRHPQFFASCRSRLSRRHATEKEAWKKALKDTITEHRRLSLFSIAATPKKQG